MQSFSRIALTATIHSVILLFVAIIPVMVYEWVTAYALQGHPRANAFALIGGFTYPSYAAYWISRIRNRTTRVVLFHLLSLVTLSLAVSGIGDAWHSPVLQLSFPIVWALGLAPMGLTALAQRDMASAKVYAISIAIAFPVAAIISAYLFVGLGMSAMAGMRW